jgi:Fic family protein
MNSVTCKEIKLIMPEPKFGSNLTTFIIELEHLRKKRLGGSTCPQIFFQLKKLFHMLESIGSARIEGNQTTILEYIEKKLENLQPTDDSILEIVNTQKAMEFIDENINDTPINRAFISEIHKLVVKGLSKEGSKSPGIYRKINVKINKSKHIPPDYMQVETLMDELFTFISKKDQPKFDLLKNAISHHRFAWIHPFDNGNGRTVRLITYTMLLKQGFNVGKGRILNPTAVFCNDRNRYYNFLSEADKGDEQGILKWCEYVLSGLKNEIEKIDKLLDYKFLIYKIMMPAIGYAFERENITNLEKKILIIAIKNQIFQSSDLKALFPGKAHTERSRVITKLKDKKMVKPIKPNSRKYVISFDNSYLIRGVIKSLADNDFIPLKE